ncbi:hypothetical protein MMB232_02791 [Brevundimonas subvibrioides]|uniref:hypothetical protein n=1 Tax=Brevundimonas subvibrioides TaxID=74313 RepID=UPI0032D58D0F
MMRASSIAAGLALALAPSITLAQSPQAVTGVSQISPRAGVGDDAAVAQIGHRSARTVVTISQPISPAGPTDLNTPQTAAHTLTTQVNTDTSPTPRQTQLTFGPAVADAPASPTNREEGRNTATQALTGRDRCDPREATTTGGVCRGVIETRSAEFTAPDIQPLSPEQRLMISQRALAENGQDTLRATRRLARGDVDDTNAGMAIASMVAVSTMGGREEPESIEPSATDAIVAGIVASLGGQTPQ